MSAAYKNLHHENIMVRLISGVFYCIFACFLLNMVFFCSQLYAKSTSLDNIYLPADIETSADSLQNDLYPQPRKNDYSDSYEIPLDLSYRLPDRLEEDIMDKKVITIDDLIKDYQKRFLQPMIEDDYKPDKSDRAIIRYVESLPPSSQTVFSNEQTSQEDSLSETILPISKLAKTFCPVTSEVKPLDISNRWVWKDNELEREKIKIKEDYFSRDHELNKAVGRTLQKNKYNSTEILPEPWLFRPPALSNIIFWKGGKEIPSNEIATNFTTDFLYIGNTTDAEYTHSSGVINVTISTYIGYNANVTGTFYLQGGEFQTNQEMIGVYGKGNLYQTGGYHKAEEMYIGYANSGFLGVQNNSIVDVSNVYAGFYANGEIVIGKSNESSASKPRVTAGHIYLGNNRGSEGTLRVNNAILKTNYLSVGYNRGYGNFEILSSEADITVNNSLEFTRSGRFKSDVESQIVLDSAAFIIKSNIAENFTDFSNLTLEFCGENNLIEAAGGISGVFGTSESNPNFALNAIAFNGSTVLLEVQNVFDNQLGIALEDEGLYVSELIIHDETHATIDLNGCSIYFENYDIESTNGSIVIENGTIHYNNTIYDYLYLDSEQFLTTPATCIPIPVAVPEPSVILLFISGICWILFSGYTNFIKLMR